MADRYYSNQPIQGDHAILEGQEAQHLGKVMRAGPGDRLTLFDNSGDQFEAEIDQVQRQKISLRILSRQSVSRELPISLTLFTALPKGDRQRWLVEKAVELGVTRMVPLDTDRSVVKPNEKTIGKIRRAVIEASKQCGRNRLMEIDIVHNWTDVLTDASVNTSPTRFIAHPIEKENFPTELQGPICIAIGPEGGFTEEEVQQAIDAGWQAIGLGPRILRIETAALSLVARMTQLLKC
ncbi:MAG: 16S rRNA (uracil(1498)-N(3))-methyltransferase [Planctomycetia bacterium]